MYRPDCAGDWDETKLTASDRASGDGFARSRAVAGEWLVVSGARSVYPYEPDVDGTWIETNLVTSDRTGLGSIATSGGRIVGGPGILRVLGIHLCV